MRRTIAVFSLLLLMSATAAASECSALRKTGPTDRNIDVLLVGGEDYTSEQTMKDHFSYFVGTEDRGLFDVYPMNVTVDRFNVWYVFGRNGSSTTSGDRGPFREARHWLDQCDRMDYAAFMAKTSHSWSGGAMDVLRVDDVSGKVEAGNGATGLIHEWGHLFGNVADEYNYGEGKKPSTEPNCAYNQSQAEDWWGEMASVTDKVGYEQGCKGSENVDPHPGGTIMGDGGLWHYGPVNARNFLQVIANETWPVTDIAIAAYNRTDSAINLTVAWENASNVVNVSVAQKPRTTLFAHGSGNHTVTLSRPNTTEYTIDIDTVETVRDANVSNNNVTITSLEDNTTDDNLTGNTTDTSADTALPSIVLVLSPDAPLPNETVTFYASASDNVSVANVTIYVDGNEVKTCTSDACSYSGGPYTANTTHDAYADAYDTSANNGTSDTVSFTVQDTRESTTNDPLTDNTTDDTVSDNATEDNLTAETNTTDADGDDGPLCGDGTCSRQENWTTCPDDCEKPEPAREAEQAMTEADTAIDRGDAGYETLQSAKAAFQAGNYTAARRQAEAAMEAYNESQEVGLPLHLIAVIAAVAVLATALLLGYWKRDRLRSTNDDHRRPAAARNQHPDLPQGRDFRDPRPGQEPDRRP